MDTLFLFIRNTFREPRVVGEACGPTFGLGKSLILAERDPSRPRLITIYITIKRVDRASKSLLRYRACSVRFEFEGGSILVAGVARLAITFAVLTERV